jgi:uncharacterized membrane protein
MCFLAVDLQLLERRRLSKRRTKQLYYYYYYFRDAGVGKRREARKVWRCGRVSVYNILRLSQATGQ